MPVILEPRSADSALAISPREFQRVVEFVRRRLGIRLSAAKVPLLQSRLQRRVRALGCVSLDAYVRQVIDGDAGTDELPEFIDAITTNKTDFFRERQHFEYLTNAALPALDPGAGHVSDLRIWSAGCSSGQEVYTLAMVLQEYAAARGQCSFQVLGTDVSRRVLQAAEVAIYDSALVEPVPPAWRARYLLRSRDPGSALVRIAPELRARVAFRRLNFMEASYDVGGPFDAIFFRNVMIYFDKPTQEIVLNRLCERLRPGGYLFIGHSESLNGTNVPLESVAPAVYRLPR